MERLNQFYDWLDHRTGIRDHIREALFEKVPGGSRWRYVWGSTLTFALMIQFITGIFLWMGYSASGQTSWESVYYIQEHMTGGHFLRGLHHWTAQVMTVLLVLHLMQVVIDGAYKAPREVNFWFGLILLKLVLALSLTGYLLPWDQKGYWATKVATDILGGTPLIGDWLKQLVLGGADYGHHTLTRFFALHAGILPMAVIALTVGHIYLFRRHGIKPKEDKNKGNDEFFWPEQVLKDAVACLAVLATVLVLYFAFNGAHLDAPADPSSAYPARPDWYFLFLFQFLKYFPGHWEVLGAIVLPGIAMTLVFLMPIIGKSERGHRFNVGLLFVILAFAGVLTYMAVKADRNNPTYIASKEQAAREAAIVKELAKDGIPPEGALALLQGPKLFAQHCASCHTHGGNNGLGQPVEKPSAPDLKGFASREWLKDFFDPEQFAGTNFFGGTAHGVDGEMIDIVEKVHDKEDLPKVIAALSAEARLPSQTDIDKRDKNLIIEGRDLFEEKPFSCTKCHSFHSTDFEDTDGPDLTGYGSREWTLAFLHNPEHMRFYPETNDRMPAFGKDEKLTRRQMEQIVDWLRGE